MVEVVIEVPAADAADEADALEFAGDLCEDLKLEVKLGGVPLASRFL